MGAGGSTIAHDLASHAEGARRRPALAHRRFRPQTRRGSKRSARSMRSSARRSDSTTSSLPDARDNDAALAALRPGSLVVNATGLGKDAPGSPLTDAAAFRSAPSPGTSTIAATSFSSTRRRAQASRRALQVEDGWTYFLHGWLQVIAEVFHIPIPVRGPEFEALSEIAQVARKGVTHGSAS